MDEKWKDFLSNLPAKKAARDTKVEKLPYAAEVLEGEYKREKPGLEQLGTILSKLDTEVGKLKAVGNTSKRVEIVLQNLDAPKLMNEDIIPLIKLLISNLDLGWSKGKGQSDANKYMIEENKKKYAGMVTELFKKYSEK